MGSSTWFGVVLWWFRVVCGGFGNGLGWFGVVCGVFCNGLVLVWGGSLWVLQWFAMVLGGLGNRGVLVCGWLGWFMLCFAMVWCWFGVVRGGFCNDLCGLVWFGQSSGVGLKGGLGGLPCFV